VRIQAGRQAGRRIWQPRNAGGAGRENGRIQNPEIQRTIYAENPAGRKRYMAENRVTAAKRQVVAETSRQWQKRSRKR